MRGCYCDGASIRLRSDLEMPVPRPGEVLVRVGRVGICDTDLELAKGYMGFRGILGHEFVGLAEDGRRVTAEINNSCHACQTCLAGRANHCPNRTVLGIVGHDGAMADWVSVPARNLHEVPDSIGDDEAVFIEPLASAFRIEQQVDLGPDVSVAVLGDGKLGILCAWAIRLTGADITLVGNHDEKLALAGDEVATCRLDQSGPLGGRFDVVVDSTGAAGGLADALKLVRPGGTVVLKTTVAVEHRLNLAPVVVDEVRIVGSRCGPFERAIRALSGREVRVAPLIEARFPLDRVEDAFALAGRRGSRKVILEVD